MPRWSTWFVRFALLSLVVGVVMGAITLAAPSFAPPTFIAAHIELLLVGWFLHLALGVASWILPKFPHKPRYGSERLAWTSFGLTSTGTIAATTLVLAAASPSAVSVARLLTLVGCGVFAAYIAPRIRAFGG